MEQVIQQIGSENVPPLFYQLKRKVERGELRIQSCIPVTPPEDIAKAKRLWTTAQASGWNEEEFRWHLYREFNIHIQAGLDELARHFAKVPDWNYQAALTKFQSPPESICVQCGNRGCEHLRAEKERLFEEWRRTVFKAG